MNILTRVLRAKISARLREPNSNHLSTDNGKSFNVSHEKAIKSYFIHQAPSHNETYLHTLIADADLYCIIISPWNCLE